MSDSEGRFLGLPDDLARLGLQRLLACDLRSRSYDRAARVWQRTATALGALAAVVASLAAISFVQDLGWLAISLSIAVAILVPLQNSLGAPARAEANRSASTAFEVLANDYERYVQLDLGPPMWRGELIGLDDLRARLAALDDRLSSASSVAPRVRYWEKELAQCEARGEHLVAYLQMENAEVPDPAVWSR
jgi:hypothetical protein